MNNDSWYREENWDEKSKEEFEQRLKRSRGSYNKAQYLRIKGSILIKSSKPEKQEAGVELLTRLIQDYQNEASQIIFAYELLGDYYADREDYTIAELNYRQIIRLFKESGRSGSSGIGDIKLAEIIIKTDQIEKFDEMFHILTDNFEKTSGLLLLNEDIFRYYSALAKLCDKLGKINLSKESAKKALEISEIKEAQFSQHPQLGVVQSDISELDKLRKILIK